MDWFWGTLIVVGVMIAAKIVVYNQIGRASCRERVYDLV